MTEKPEKTNAKNGSENKEDEELSALLDSALEDFNTTPKATDSKQASLEKSEELKRPDPPQTLWDEEFLMKKFVQQTAAAFEQNLQNMFSPGADGNLSTEQLAENIQRLTEAATQTAGFDASPDTEFSGIIAQTLRNLQENADNLQNGINDEELMNLLGSIGNLTDSGTDANGFLPIMQQMMQNLLSKEILHPALFSIVEKYPQWLEDNKSKLSAADFERYTEQQKIMKEICAELEKETPEDSQEVKNARFDQILGMMQKVQDCGQPPAELVGDFDPLLRLDEHGNPQLPANFSPNQCNLM